jgi:hypothetical protein
MSQEVMKSISDALGMNPLTVESEQKEETLNLPAELEEQVEELTKEEQEGEEDFYLARDNIKQLLEKGTDALDKLALIASSTEQPRAFEILSTLIKTLTDSNKQLLDIHEKRRQLLPVVPVKKEEEVKQQTLQANNVFIGTTSDFLTLLEEKRRQVADERIIEGTAVEVKDV